MGVGYGFKCKKCGYYYDVHLGVGMMFPRVYDSCINDIKAGKYGKEWRKIALSQEYIAVDASKYLYICKSCNHWKVSYSLSLYKPKDIDSIQNKQYTSYVTPSMLEYEYTFIKSYIHKCDKCSKRMCRYDINSQSSLVCPKCGTDNEVSELIRWD